MSDILIENMKACPIDDHSTIGIKSFSVNLENIGLGITVGKGIFKLQLPCMVVDTKPYNV